MDCFWAISSYLGLIDNVAQAANAKGLGRNFGQVRFELLQIGGGLSVGRRLQGGPHERVADPGGPDAAGLGISPNRPHDLVAAPGRNPGAQRASTSCRSREGKSFRSS